MDPITIIAAATAAVKLVETIRNLIKAGKVQNPDGSPMTEAQYDAIIAKARQPVTEGIDVATRELGGGPG